jgi:hypothetical protein
MTEETTEFDDVAIKLHTEELAIRAMINLMDFLGNDESKIGVGMCCVTNTTFIAGMLAYRMHLEEVAPEWVEKVDTHIRTLAEEKTNE